MRHKAVWHKAACACMRHVCVAQSCMRMHEAQSCMAQSCMRMHKAHSCVAQNCMRMHEARVCGTKLQGAALYLGPESFQSVTETISEFNLCQVPLCTVPMHETLVHDPCARPLCTVPMRETLVQDPCARLLCRTLVRGALDAVQVCCQNSFGMGELWQI